MSGQDNYEGIDFRVKQVPSRLVKSFVWWIVGAIALVSTATLGVQFRDSYELRQTIKALQVTIRDDQERITGASNDNRNLQNQVNDYKGQITELKQELTVCNGKTNIVKQGNGRHSRNNSER